MATSVMSMVRSSLTRPKSARCSQEDAEIIYGGGPARPDRACPPAGDTWCRRPRCRSCGLRDPYRFIPCASQRAAGGEPRQPEELLASDQDEIATPMLTDLAPVAARIPWPVVEAAPIALEAAPVAEVAPVVEALEEKPVLQAEAEPELLDEIEILSESEVAPFVAIASSALGQPVAPPPAPSRLPPPAPVRHVRETPHPRLAMPKPRPSDVSDLIGRLDSAPLPSVDLRSELKTVAGLNRPPPRDSDSSD